MYDSDTDGTIPSRGPDALRQRSDTLVARPIGVKPANSQRVNRAAIAYSGVVVTRTFSKHNVAIGRPFTALPT
jgi:hypothetical protein